MQGTSAYRVAGSVFNGQVQGVLSLIMGILLNEIKVYGGAVARNLSVIERQEQ